VNSWLAPGFLADLNQNPPLRIFAPGREHIGDAANLTGPLRGLRELFPSAHITVEIGERAAGVLENQTCFDELWKRPTHQGFRGKLSHIRRLRRAKFDLAVILDDSNDLVLQATLGGIPRRVGIWRGVKYQGLFQGWVRYRHDIHEVRDNGEELLMLLGLPPGRCVPALFPSERDRTAALAAWEGTGKPRVGIHPGASMAGRQWRPDRLREVADAFAGQVVLLAGPGEERLLDAIDPDRVHHRVAGGLSVLGFASLLGRLEVMVGMDSGPMHLAAIMGTRVVALFGTADPRHTGPVGEGHVILRQSDIESSNEVIEAVREALGGL
jgi:ADP-heptose:LPS heptosyltransferase